LLSWSDRGHHLWLLWLTLAWAAFFLWSFVFAWHHQYTGRPVFRVKPTPGLWIAATLGGVAGGMILRGLIDPTLRAATPGDYPDSLNSWVAMTLFVLAFDQLFLCFAPMAFFARLWQHAVIAAVLTIAFGVSLVFLKVGRAGAHLDAVFVSELVIWRILAGGLSVLFYWRGGVWLNWWWVLLLQLRHLIDLM